MLITAGITTFNPDNGQLKKNLDAITVQVSRVVIVDNGSGNIAEIKKLISEYDNITSFFAPRNMGIAWALNCMMNAGSKLGADFVLTLDQDSVCPNDMIENYIQYYKKIIKKHPNDKIGILCPTVIDKSGEILEGHGKHEIESDVKCITSGALTNVAAWKDIKGFDEFMFIDGVDFDYSDRLIAAGYKIYRLRDVVLKHELGDICIRHFLFWKVRVKNHTAFRRYYIARNGFYRAKKKKSKLLFIVTCMRIFKYTCVILLYENNKKDKLSALKHGAIDGLKIKLN